MRNFLETRLSSELTVLDRKEQLLKYFCTQNSIEMSYLTEETKAVLVRIAKEQKLSVAFTLHTKLRNTTKSVVWADGLRSVLGQNFVTEQDAIRDHPKDYESKVKKRADTKLRIKKELEKLKKNKDLTPDALAIEIEESKKDFLVACTGANLFLCCCFNVLESNYICFI